MVCSSGSPASRSQQHRTNITSRFRGQVGSPTRGLQKKQHHARKVCTVPGRFQSQTLGRSTKFSLSAHFTSGLELVALPRWLAICACTWRTCHSRLGLAVGLVVVVPLQVLGASPWQYSPLLFWLVAPLLARWAFLLAVQRRHRCPMVFPLDPMATLAELRVVVPVVIICACWASQGAVAIPPVRWRVFRDISTFLHA